MGTLLEASMPHIFLDPTLPGILSLLAYRRETAKPLTDLAEVLLRGESPLTRGERELIAAYVSEQNDCEFCAASHGACAAMLLPPGHPAGGPGAQGSRPGADLRETACAAGDRGDGGQGRLGGWAAGR
jgi:hypothetical protein